MTRADLTDTSVETYSITRLLEVIGEAAKSVTQDLRDRYPAIPWREVARLRDRLIHGYFDVDLDILWDIVENDPPVFITDLADIIVAEGF